MRDNNDLLVSMTLHAVAELVPILGGDIVIGAKRNKIFIEGTPNVSIPDSNIFGNTCTLVQYCMVNSLCSLIYNNHVIHKGKLTEC